MSGMVERVARAMMHPLSQSWDLIPTENKVEMLRMARAAIVAMRDCTPEMLDAGSAAHPAGGYKRSTLLNDIIECEWRAMVDAALGGL